MSGNQAYSKYYGCVSDLKPKNYETYILSELFDMPMDFNEAK